MTDSPDRVVLLEAPDEVQAYADECFELGLDPSASHVISLHPRAMVGLRSRGIRCVNSLPYFSSEAHARALYKSAELLAWLESRLDLEDGLGIKIAYTDTLLWYSRYFLHHVLWLSELLSEVASKHPDATFHAPLSPMTGSRYPLIQNSEMYLGSLAESFCRQQGIGFQPIATPSTNPNPRREKAYTRWLKRGAFKLGGHLHRSALRRLGQKQPLLSLTHTYRMDRLVQQARREVPDLPWVVLGETDGPLRGPTLLRTALRAVAPGLMSPADELYLGEAWLQILERTTREDRVFARDLSAALNMIANAVEEETEMFSHREVSFGPQFAAKIRSGIAPAMRTMHREISAFDEMLSLLRPRLVMTPFGRRSHHALGELGRRRGINGLLISHGSFTPTESPLEKIAWDFHGFGLFHGSFTHAALQTPLAEAYSRELESSSNFVRTGPLAWGGLVQRDGTEALKERLLNGNRNCRVVLQASTIKSRRGIHFHVYETPDEWVAHLHDLVSAVNDTPDTFLIIKSRFTHLGPNELRSLLPPSERFSISVEEPFLEVLGLADLLVSFASTTIEEALQNRVPVLQYGGDGRYQHVQAMDVTPDSDIKPNAVYAVRRPEHLADGLRRILDTNGKAPLPAELFRQYVYDSQEITEFPKLVRDLAEASTFTG